MNVQKHPRDKNIYPTYLGALLQYLENIKSLSRDGIDDSSVFKEKFTDAL